MITLYGIPNCDSCRRARRWLDQQDIEYRWHDLRRDGVRESTLRDWLTEFGWEKLLNRRGRSWRELSPEQKAGLDEAKALALVRQQPLLIKRPVLETAGKVLAGFDAGAWQALFKSTGDG